MESEGVMFLSSPHMSHEGYEFGFIKEAFDTNWIAPVGKNIDEFEKELAEKVGVKNGVALSSGTAAIHMALKSCGVGRGDIVFCPTFTFAATANPIIYQGAYPVFIDSDESWNMNPDLLEEAFKHYEPKAVIVVHLYGLSAEMDDIVKICRKHDVPLIEDAAESLGTTFKGKQTGTIGDYGIYSFNGNKIITTSGGGMLVSNNDLSKVKFWSTQSRDKARHYQHSELGYNYRMSNICAGIGRGQLKVLDERVEKKREIFHFYKKHLEMMPENAWNRPNFWLSCAIVENPLKVIETLEKDGIESRPIWKPLHLQPFFEKYPCFGGVVSEWIYNNGVCLPSDTKMTTDDLERVVSWTKTFGKTRKL